MNWHGVSTVSWTRSTVDNRAVSSNLNDILLAQDYQDLTGQAIKRVTQLVTEESNLLKLVLMASQVDRFAGIEHDREAMLAEKDPQTSLRARPGARWQAAATCRRAPLRRRASFCSSRRRSRTRSTADCNSSSRGS